MRKFIELPLGTRFTYQGQATEWVILEHFGCGKVAKWQGIDGPLAGQSVCSAAETEEGCQALVVVPSVGSVSLSHPRRR